MLRLFRLLLDPDPADGGGNPDPDPIPTTPDEVTRAFNNALEKHGNDPLALARELYGENFKARQKARDLESKLPAEGSVVLAGDDAATWSEYQKLGKPADVKARIAEADGLRREKHVGEVAAVAGFRPAVLNKLAGDLALEVRDVKLADGKTTRMAVVVGEGGTTTPLQDYARAHWRDFEPALRDTGSAPTAGPGTPPRRTAGTPPALGGPQGDGRTNQYQPRLARL